MRTEIVKPGNSLLILLILLISITGTTAQKIETEHESHLHKKHRHAYHDHDVYQLDKKREMWLLGTGVTLSLAGGYLLNSVEEVELGDIELLDKTTLWNIDRSATNNFSSKGELMSDVLLYTSFAIPFWVYLTDTAKGERRDCIVMTLETLFITSGLTNIAKGLSKRYRPYNYNPVVPESLKLSHGSRLSFFSGHVSNTAAFCFLTAQALNDMHPHWKAKKYITWSTAAVLPLAIGYGRYKAGKHFTTDILTGYVLGAGMGLLMPRLHRSDKVSVGMGAQGLSATIKLNKS